MDIFGFPISSLPCTYLGIPISTNKIPQHLLRPVIQNINRVLLGWMTNLLSCGVRLQMVNAVLPVTPKYFTSCKMLSEESIEKIDKLCRSVPCKNSNGSHCLVACDYVILPIESGGLGARNLGAHNSAMLCKLMNLLLQGSNIPCWNWLQASRDRPFNPAKHKLDIVAWEDSQVGDSDGHG